MTLVIDQVRVRLGRFSLGPLTATVPAGQVTAILGPNGSGKSTLLRAACGLQRLDGGVVRLHGRSLAEMRPSARAEHLAFVAQRPSVPPALTVEEVVGLGRLRRHDAAAVRQSLSDVGLLDRRLDPLDQLSEGQRHRAAIARALLQVREGAGLLAVDEPTSSLDPSWSSALAGRLRASAGAGMAVLLATHDLVFAADCGDRAILLRGGAVEAEGTCHEVLAIDRLERAFGVPFERLARADGRPVVVPRP
jgi:iron complex transport system ATP-binding protein